jgi:hypothetical protein
VTRAVLAPKNTKNPQKSKSRWKPLKTGLFCFSARETRKRALPNKTFGNEKL